MNIDCDTEIERQVQRTGALARAAVPHIRLALSSAPQDWRKVSYRTDCPSGVRPFVTGYCGSRGVGVKFKKGVAGSMLAIVTRLGMEP